MPGRTAARAAAVGGLVALGIVLGRAGAAEAGASPHRSEEWLPSSNGMAAIAWDRTQNKITQFLEHPYQAQSASTQSRNFAFDSYPGVRIGTVGTAGTWLNGVAPVVAEYVPGTGIVHSLRSLSGLQIDEYDFTPMGLAEYASVMLVKVTQTGASAGPVDVYSLFNYHLGSGSPSPGEDSETLGYDATRDAYYESGPSGVAFGYASILPSTHHGCTPNNPFARLNSGANLADDAGTGGPTTAAVPGFQSSVGTLAANGTAWVGWLTVLAPDANASAAVDRVRTWAAGRPPDKLLADETTAWQAWTKPPPAGASTLEAALALQAQVVLRMGQVRETGSANGQILASVAPGQWNIAWVRDMAYATVGLLRSGHYAEAKAAITFQLGASSGTYQTYVGAPYQISVVRYYGNGTEWSDSNADGPNIELDGFGLFLWELDEYVRASGDTASLATWWPMVKSKVADVLVGLQETTGLIKADSSIWEVHWNGQQKHFAYTTLTAANGLCSAARLATAAGDTASATGYLAAGQKSRDALMPNLRAPDGTLAQSTEALAVGTGWLDAAVLEAIDFGLIDPTLHTATATIAGIQAGLVPQSGRGLKRSDAGDAYSSNEWVFIDLRAARALELHGDVAGSADLFTWNVNQASDNFGELSELHDPVTADYAGQSPMVGFGGGAYLLRLFDRGTPQAPTCGTFAVEPAVPDAGPGTTTAASSSSTTTTTGSGGATTSGSGGANPSTSSASSAGSGGSGGAPGTGGAGGSVTVGGFGGFGGGSHVPTAGSSGCGCVVAPTTDWAGGAWALIPLALLVRRRRRS
jgi:MYXO-CTERM domain-containing protein